MSHRDFPITPAQYEPLTFTVAGHEFKTLSDPPGGALADLFWAYQGDMSAQAAGIVRFIEGCMSDEVADEFRLVVHDKDTIVPLAVLIDVCSWLVEEYTTRPTTPSSGLGIGSSPTPVSPEGGAGSQESTSAEPVSSS